MALPKFPTRATSPRVRQALNAIDTVLARGDQDAADLWAVLTALRSPDTDLGHGTAKQYLTVVIRKAAFPATERRAREGRGVVADFLSQEIALRFDRVASGAIPRHADDHIRSAGTALGLLFKERD